MMLDLHQTCHYYHAWPYLVHLVTLAGKLKINVTGFTKTVPISTRKEIQFIADY